MRALSACACVIICLLFVSCNSVCAVLIIWLELNLQQSFKSSHLKTLCQVRNYREQLVPLAPGVLHTPEGPLTSCCSQTIPAGPSLCCCRWNSPPTRARCSRCHGCRCRDSHCRATRSRCRWSRCSSSPRPPRWASGTCCSCGGCAARPRGPGRCCRCPPTGGLAQPRPGCSPPCGAAVPWSCSRALPWASSWMRRTLCTLRIPLHPPAPGSNTAWSLNFLTWGDGDARCVSLVCWVVHRWVTPCWQGGGQVNDNCPLICREKSGLVSRAEPVKCISFNNNNIHTRNVKHDRKWVKAQFYGLVILRFKITTLYYSVHSRIMLR